MSILNSRFGQLLTAFCLLSLCEISQAQRTFEVGAVIHLGGAGISLSTVQSNLDTLGVTFRNEVQWHGIEVTQGALKFPPNENLLETLVADAASHQRQPILLLDYGNKFYDNGGQITSPAGIEAYTKYVRFVVNHYKATVHQYEVWNEWIYGAGANNQQLVKGDATQYANLLKATYSVIKQEDPNAIVLGPTIGVGGKETQWLKDFAAAGGLNYLDGFSIHPYVHCNARNRPTPAVSGAMTPYVSAGVVPGGPEDSIYQIDQQHALISSLAPGKVITIYVTEIGWPASNGKCGVPDSVAAVYLERFFLLASTRPWIGGVWWYDLVDDGKDLSNMEDTFGLMTSYLTKKPAYDALQAISTLLYNNHVPTFTRGPGGEYVVSGITAAGKKFTAAWLPTNSFTAAKEWTGSHRALESGMKVLGGHQLVNGNSVSAEPVLLVQP
jgi:hypothetical protein